MTYPTVNRNRLAPRTIEALVGAYTVEDPTTSCWLWSMSLERGYPTRVTEVTPGRFVLGHDYRGLYPNHVRKQPAHRAVYRAVTGTDIDGLELHHLCGVRSCVNPTHLLPLTAEAHSQLHATDRKLATALAASPTVDTTELCKRGHAWEATTYTKPGGGRYCKACRCVAQQKYNDRLRATTSDLALAV